MSSSKGNTHVASRLGSSALSHYGKWRDAMRWQRSLDRALRSLSLTHTRLLVLASLDTAIRRADDAVPLSAIAEEAGLDRGTASSVLQSLEKLGLVDRGGVNSEDQRALRVWITRKGERVLDAAVPLAEAAAAATPAPDRVRAKS
ncbi:MAG TPA: helix-turn-helix domain-containing protein [Polyangiaceae bacterium]|nr:helix-turn-helix domain-containing protein [Polyangiaceae bacterium]